MVSVVVTGLPCSGKTAIADALAERLRWPHIECSSILRELRREHGLDEPLADFAERIAPDAIGQRVVAHLADGRAVVSGPRSRADLLYVVESVGAVVVLVHADEAVRMERARGRARDEFASPAAFQANERRQAQLGLLGELEVFSDVRVDNSRDNVPPLEIAGRLVDALPGILNGLGDPSSTTRFGDHRQPVEVP